MTSGIGARRPRPLRVLLAALALAAAGAAQAADIVIAHIAPFSGPAANEATEYNAGIRLAFKAANAGGGVAGHKLVLRSEDDHYAPDRAVALFNEVGDSPALAALLPVGSPAMTRVLAEHIPETRRLPIVGVVPGAEPLRAPLNPYVYHVRAGDLDQYRRLVDHAMLTGLTRVAVAYADVPFGAAGLAAIEGMLKQHKQAVVARVAVPVGGRTDFAPALDLLAKAAPDIVLLVSPSQLAGEFVKAYRARALSPVLAVPSYGDAGTICRIAGNDAARGVVVAQVMPNLNNSTIPIVRRFQDDLHKHGEKDMHASMLQLEGYVTAQVLLEGIRRAGAGVNRARLTAALDGMKAVDLGGFALEFSASRHTGSSFVDISIIGRECRLIY